MADTFIVGTMSTTSGWETTSVTEALAKHITYWFQSRYNQGRVLGKTPSFYYLFKTYGQTPDRLIEQSQIELESYIKELFPVCRISVTKEDISDRGSVYRMIIAAVVVSQGQSYDLAQAVLVTGSKYKLIDEERIG